MKALVYREPRLVAVERVEDARLEASGDVVVRVERAGICGADLRAYRGRTRHAAGAILGHESIGEVVEAGPSARQIRVGDWVCVAAEAASGGQAELLRVPDADAQCLPLPDDARAKQNDYLMLSHVFPAGFHATELAGVGAGESVVVYGAGTVGLMAAYSAILRGAGLVMVVDRMVERLVLAEALGAVGIDASRSPPVEEVLQMTGGRGADKGCECVGFGAHDAAEPEHPNKTMNDLVRSVRVGGSIGGIGAFVPPGPEAETEAEREPCRFDWGLLRAKDQRIGAGPVDVKSHARQLRDLIACGKARPSFIVSHELGLDEAPWAYTHLDIQDDRDAKVLLAPNNGTCQI